MQLVPSSTTTPTTLMNQTSPDPTTTSTGQSSGRGLATTGMAEATTYPPLPHFRSDDKRTIDYSILPPGWETAVHPADGRMYYFEKATGRTSWEHPYFLAGATATAIVPDVGAESNGEGWNIRRYFSRNKQQAHEDFYLPHRDNPIYANEKPDTHECNSFLAMILFPPIGLLAVYHTLAVNWSWESGRYGDAINHARQAPKYASLAMCFGIVFWLWFFLLRTEEQRQRWSDIDLNFD